MKTVMPRYVKQGDWIFEIKTVRALRVDEYGEPYDALATLNVNGEMGFIDGLVTKEEGDFKRKDLMTFYKFFESLGLKGFSYDRYHDGKADNKEYIFDTKPAKSNVVPLKLVK